MAKLHDRWGKVMQGCMDSDVDIVVIGCRWSRLERLVHWELVDTVKDALVVAEHRYRWSGWVCVGVIGDVVA